MQHLRKLCLICFKKTDGNASHEFWKHYTPKGANTKRDTHRRQLQIKQEQLKDYRTSYPQSIKMVASRVRNRKQLLWPKHGLCSLCLDPRQKGGQEERVD